MLFITTIELHTEWRLFWVLTHHKETAFITPPKTLYGNELGHKKAHIRAVTVSDQTPEDPVCDAAHGRQHKVTT
jgi:hypothetical protein